VSVSRDLAGVLDRLALSSRQQQALRAGVPTGTVLFLVVTDVAGDVTPALGLLAVALAVGVGFWPYPVRCGALLAGYLAVVAAVIGAGVWSSIWTWRHRTARAHLLSLLIVVWGLVLGAMEVLPRAGYAIPTAAHPAAWRCQ